MNQYMARGWIHPKRGGDDKTFDLDINAEDAIQAKKLTQDWLIRRSCVLDDFDIFQLVKQTL